VSQPDTELRFYHADLTPCEHGPGAGGAAQVGIGGRTHLIPAQCGARQAIAYWTCTHQVAADLVTAQAPAYLDVP
jgi:hypothetical protein